MSSSVVAVAPRTTAPGAAAPQPAPRWRGVLLATGLAAVAALVGTWLPVVGGPVCGLALGLLTRAVLRVDRSFQPGLVLCSKQVLQVAIVLLGAGLSLGQVWATGVQSLAVMLSTLLACLGMAWLAGRLLGTAGGLTTLIGVGTAICGASAIAAAAPVVDAEESDVAYALATIFAFNIAAVALFPLLGHALGLNQSAFGLWAGTAVNDTSSVLAVAYGYGTDAGTYATVVKLTRSTLIIPIVLGLAALRLRRSGTAGASGGVRIARLIPWFLPGFLMAALVNTLGVLPAAAVHGATGVGKFLMVVALTAVGLSSDFRQLVRTGPKPLLLGLLLWVTVGATSLLAQHLTGQF